jgi:hypothetical protein
MHKTLDFDQQLDRDQGTGYEKNFPVNSDIFISDLEAKILDHLTVLKKEHSCHFHTYVSKMRLT